MFRFALTIFISAFLLFLIQPMIGRYILPWFGGAAGVWAVCLVFFQTVLLAGYAYAFALDRWLKPRGQMCIHMVLLLACLSFLPTIPGDQWKPSPLDQPSIRILLLLTVCLGLPYLALASTGPLLQAWFARRFPQKSPYPLYALSNAGSLLALMGYPFVFEPLWSRRVQALIWAAGFVAFAIACGWCAFSQSITRSAHVTESSSNARNQPQGEFANRTGWDRWLWVLFPACASMALVSSTTKLTQDIAPIPFLWIIPLAVYLLSFILCFEWPGIYRRSVLAVALLASMGLTSVLTWQPLMGLTMQIALFAIVLGVCCMVCHGEVYRLRPAASGLTAYYLAIAAGGAIGGAFVAIAAPLILSRTIEFELAIFGTGALLLTRCFTDPAAYFFRGAHRAAWLTTIMLGLAAAVALMQRMKEFDANVAWRARNFYGVLSIRAHPSERGDEGEMRVLYHGWIRHGAQVINDSFRQMPTLYFGVDSGVGRLLRSLPDRPCRVGIIGLGVGTLAAYGRSGDVFRFYEIDPNDIHLANTYFTYIDDSAASVEIVAGDARLSLEREPVQGFDVLVLDAFNGDSIPMHLLTREAFALYQKHLAPDGVIAVHVSNKFLDLFPVVNGAATDMGFGCVLVATPEDRENLVISAQWVLMSRNAAILDRPLIREAATAAQADSHRTLWTDEHASVFSAIR